MKISDVLASKGDRIETMGPTRTISDIVTVFDEKGISSVVIVSPPGEPLGIVTDRVIIHALASHRTDVLDVTAAEVMQPPMPTCKPDDDITHAMQMMTIHKVRHLIVRNEGKMAGIVSIGDLVEYRIRDAELERAVLRDIVAAR